MLKEHVTLIVGLIAPLITGVFVLLGVRMAFARFTKERAFEHRMKWYEDAIRTVVTYVGALQALSGAARRGADKKHQSDLVDMLNDAFAAMMPILNIAMLYARGSAVEAVNLLLSANKQLLSPIPIDANNLALGYTMDVESIDRAAVFATAVAKELTSELRDHLGLERLPTTVPVTRFPR